MLGILPNPWLMLGGLAALALIASGCLFEGYHYRALEDAAALAGARNAVLVQTENAAAITAGSDAAAARDQRNIESFIQTQIVEVPRYVTSKSAARCVVPRGFVRLHDSAASGLPAISLGAGQSDDDPAGIDLTAVAGTVIGNYGRCRATRQQLIDLQGWITAQQASLDRFEHVQP